MPFCIWVTRADSYDEAHAKAASAALDQGFLDDMLDVIRSTREHPQDRSHWLFHPDDREPWLTLFPHESGGRLRHVELSVSFTSRWFPRNLHSMFTLALELAGRNFMNARVFEEQGGREVTTENFNELLDVQSDYVKGLVSFWRGLRKDLLTENRAPFELPLGAMDSSSDYFAFQFPTGGPPPPVAELTTGTPSHLRAYVGENAAVLEHVEKEQGAVRIVCFEDRVLVRPFWSDLPFAVLAAETLAAVDRVGGRLQVEPHTFGVPMDAAKMDEIARHAGGLGVEYFEWIMHG